MGLLDMFGGSDATPTPTGGGMFDAYSPQNQTNLQMAMMADIVGNVMGKDVNAMKTAMPLVENARKLRLQEEESASFNKMVEGMSPEMQALASNAPQGLRNTIMQGYIANMNRAKPVTGGETKIGPNGALLQLMSDGSWNKVSGARAMGDTINYGGGDKLNELSAKSLIELEGAMDAASDGASGKLNVHENMLRMLEAKDPNDPEKFKTEFGKWAEMTHGARQVANSLINSFGGEKALKSMGLSDTTMQTIFSSKNKDLALLAAALMKGNLSEKELDFSVDLFSQLGNTREANIVLTKLGIMKEKASISLNNHMLDWRNTIMESNPNIGTDELLRKFRTESNKFKRSQRLNNDAESQLMFFDLKMIDESNLSDSAQELYEARLEAEAVRAEAIGGAP
jgi:hypothetical protein